MRPLSKVLTSLLFTSLVVNLLNAEEGLFKVKDSKVPGSIEIASESVVQIVLTGGPIQKIPQANYDSYLNAQPGDNFMLFIAIQKVKDCKQHFKSECEISMTSYGSGFLTDDGLNLWTARHVMSPQLSWKSLSFEIYNADGEKLFDTSDTKDQATVSLIGDEAVIQKRHPQYLLDQSLTSQTADYIKLRLNHGMTVRALHIASSKPKLNDRVYAAGYANIAMRGLTSQTGSVTARSRVAIGAVSNYLDAPPNETPAQKQQRLATEDFTSQHLLTMDLDGLPGQSGSPIFNESGDVVGIFTAGNSTISGHGSLRGIGPHFEGIFQNGH